jgi:hypothetical protein
METWLKAKTAGLPRWVWVAIVGGAVGVGLYLRHRSSEAEKVSEEGEHVPAEGLSAYNETEPGASLGAAGLIGPASSSMVPVQTPFLPEGIVGILEGLGVIIEHQGTVIENITISHNETQPVTIPGTGGGAPEDGGNHSPLPTPIPPRCSPQELGEIPKLQAEIARLSGEAQALAAAIATKKAQYPDWQKRPNVKQWINEQEANKTYKQQKRDEYKTKVDALRKKCAV